MTADELTTLYERYALLVHRRCRRLVGSSADADNLLHEVFLRAQRSAPPREGSSLVWLYRVATHCCFDRLRATARGARHAQRLDTGEPVVSADGDRQALVGMVLRKLDALTCEVGLLHHLDGLTQEEIASESGYSRKTVGRKLALFEVEFREHWARAGGGS